MKRNRLIIFSFLAIIILIGIFYFNTPKDNTTLKREQEKNITTTEIIQDSSYQSPIMRQLFNMKTPHNFIIQVPETDAQCKLTELIDVKSTKMIKGAYSNDPERGIVLLDYLQISPVRITSPQNQIYFAAPFLVSNQGSGVFYYLGLFMQDLNKNNIRHIDSFFLGDRIEFVTLETQKENIEIVIRTHGEDQPMSQAPNQTKIIPLQVNASGFSQK